MNNIKNPASLQNSVLLMRLFIGWHFLYEGFVKWYNPQWSAKGYLMGSEGFMTPFFQWLGSDSLIGFVDAANTVALLFVGFTLVLGIFERQGAIVGVVLLAFYYLAQPAFPWLQQVSVEGNYWFVNKNLIELTALVVVFNAPTGYLFGLERLFGFKSEKLTAAS